MIENITNDYYIKEKKKYFKQFLKLQKNSREILLKYIDINDYDKIIQNWNHEIEKLIPQIPYIGGKKNKRMTFFLLSGVLWLGFYRAITFYEKDIHKIGQMIYEMVENYYESLPKYQKKFMRWFYYSKLAQSKFIKSSTNRKSWNYPGDYQSDFIEGDGKNIVWGFNYTECAVKKFFITQDALELIPYLCINDYAMFKAFNVGFKRTTTIGMQGDVCDFRFLKEYNPTKGWPPDNLDEYKHYLNEIKNFN